MTITSLFARPTRRQMEVLTLMSQGLTDREIAEELGILTSTVTRHSDELRERLNAINRPHLVSLAYQYRILRIEDK